MCGGTVTVMFAKEFTEGLSPRVRGNHGAGAGATGTHGSIPACAGEPKPTSHPSSTLKVYPRVCGGTTSRRAKAFTAQGLSPRVRGNPYQYRIATVRTGSIPACAGEPAQRWTPCDCWGVYPRVCGGTPFAHHALTSVEGLSPRVRGNRPGGHRNGGSHGSIPACAGEPFNNLTAGTTYTVYPRVCGGTPSPGL